MIQEAKDAAAYLQAKYKERNQRSILSMQMEWQEDCMVIGKNKTELFPFLEEGMSEPFFFHPNSASFRIKRLLKQEEDPFIAATMLTPGMSLLDCTLGMGSDSIVASFAVGATGKVVGVEGNKYTSFIVKSGLKTWMSDLEVMNAAMKRIEVITLNHLVYLKSLGEDSFDCVYFDPMFELSILESDGLKALRTWAIYEDLSTESIKEALRVAKKRVVLKDYFRSTRFQQHQFSVKIRKSSKFHYGIIEKAD